MQEGGIEKEHVRCSRELEEFQGGWTQGKRGVGVKNETAEASKGRFLRTLEPHPGGQGEDFPGLN